MHVTSESLAKRSQSPLAHGILALQPYSLVLQHYTTGIYASKEKKVSALLLSEKRFCYFKLASGSKQCTRKQQYHRSIELSPRHQVCCGVVSLLESARGGTIQKQQHSRAPGRCTGNSRALAVFDLIVDAARVPRTCMFPPILCHMYVCMYV